MIPKVGLVDYGAGNFTSVWNALEFLGVDVLRVRTAGEFATATHIILPGVGAFAAAMKRLEDRDLIDPLAREISEKGKPFLGICSGMQVLASLGHEFGQTPGLGWIPGETRRLDAGSHGLRLPHIGWNEVRVQEKSPLYAGLGDRPAFYFVHSFHLVPRDGAIVTATCTYGSDVVASIQKDRVFGVQFHPEKSQQEGLRVLRNFISLDAE